MRIKMRMMNKALLTCFFLVACQVLILDFNEGIAQEAAQTEQVEEIIEIEDIEEIEEITPGDAGEFEAVSVPELLGRLHPAIVHLPIGWLMMVFIIDAVTFVLKKANWEQWGFYALAGTVLSFVPAMTTGFLNADYQLAASADRLELITTHRNLIIAVATICVLAFLIRFSKRHGLVGVHKLIYLGLISAATGLIGLAGHMGGKLVFGVNYLPF